MSKEMVVIQNLHIQNSTQIEKDLPPIKII